jgi:hypothetical protein
MKNGDLIKWKFDFHREIGVFLGTVPDKQRGGDFFPHFYVLFGDKILHCRSSDVQGVSNGELLV